MVMIVKTSNVFETVYFHPFAFTFATFFGTKGIISCD